MSIDLLSDVWLAALVSWISGVEPARGRSAPKLETRDPGPARLTPPAAVTCRSAGPSAPPGRLPWRTPAPTPMPPSRSASDGAGARDRRRAGRRPTMHAVGDVESPRPSVCGLARSPGTELVDRTSRVDLRRRECDRVGQIDARPPSRRCDPVGLRGDTTIRVGRGSDHPTASGISSRDRSRRDRWPHRAGSRDGAASDAENPAEPLPATSTTVDPPWAVPTHEPARIVAQSAEVTVPLRPPAPSPASAASSTSPGPLVRSAVGRADALSAPRSSRPGSSRRSRFRSAGHR